MHAYQQPFAQPQVFSMAVLGDSLAYGTGASRHDAGLVQVLHARLRDERPATTLVNLSVPHSTMGDVLRHQVPQLRRHNAHLVLLIAGANDLRYSRDVLAITQRFRALLGAIHDAAPDANVVAAGMPDVTQTVGVPRLLKAPIQRLCERLNERMRRIALSNGDGFVDMFTFTNAPLCPGEVYLCDDGYHPNDFGYAEIAHRAYPEIAAAAERFFSP